MTTERVERAVVALFALVAVCSAVSAVHTLADDGMPLWAACCRMWPMTSEPERQVGLALLGLIPFYGLARFARRFRKTQQFIRRVQMAATPAGLACLPQRTRRLSLAAGLLIVPTDVPLAFCYGLLRPRICVSTGLAHLLTDQELEAVLHHEDYHRRRYDPLRRLLLESVASALFFLPIAGELRDMLNTSSELQADRYAAQVIGRPFLAGALHKLLTHPRAADLTLSGVSGFDATHARLAQLLGDRPVPLHFSSPSLLTSSAALMALCMVAL